ncbi:hypothetical protein FOZ74_07730 [Comamonas flocculans]|uniref:Uracil-DNA glycosylase-like domain-containing protein n=2 Tax=Comamonas flocculans TaxID=2597701 RepID=A0A5B8RZ78_9BURK|nr:hypothetical protein FOZ74_07730 [Comamonas flocculans]
MLAEMGIRVWLPPPRSPADAPAPAFAPALVPSPAPARAAVSAPVAGRPAQPGAATPRAAAAVQRGWQLGPAQPLYPQADKGADGPTWLIALDSTTPDEPGGGEDGALLHKMLAAMGLKDHGGVHVATVRRAGTGSELAQLLQTLRPAVVLALGPSAASCVLGSTEPLQSLRQRAHRLADGTPALVSYAPAYLLRRPEAKRAAWQDLQRAMALAGQQGAP